MRRRAPTEVMLVTSDQGRSVPVFLDRSCICGGTRPLRYCCLKNGKVVPPSTPSPTTPRPPATGHANPRCYARATNDCDSKISKEHYLSKGVTRQLALGSPANTVRVVQPGRADLEIPPDQAAQSNVLCRRHNSALSTLDVTGEQTFRVLREGLKRIPCCTYRSLRGLDVERWLLKVACGAAAASKDDVPLEWLRVLFGYAPLPAAQGLYMHIPDGKTVDAEAGLKLGFFRREAGLSGVELALEGLCLTLDLRGDGGTYKQSGIGSVRVFRPSGIWFDHGGLTTFHVAFEWGTETSARESVVIDVQRKT